MSERLLGPNLDGRLAYNPRGGVLLSAAGASAVVYANATGDVLADIRTYDGTSTPGTPIANSTLIIDGDSFIPLFWYPINTDTVYVEVNGGTRTAITANLDARIDVVSGLVNAPMISTGIVAGGELTANALNPKAIDIAPFKGYIVDYITDQFAPSVTPITTSSTITVELDATAQTRTITFWLMDALGNIIQQDSPPTNTQRRTHLQLGSSGYGVVTGAVFFAQSTPTILFQPVNQLYDLMYALGAFSVTGNLVGSNGANLTLSKTIGTVFSTAFSHELVPSDPHITMLAAQAPVTFTHRTRLTSFTSPLTTVLDVSNYDNNGVLTPVGGGALSSTNFRVFATGSSAEQLQIVVQYGQAVYSSLANAVANIRAGSFIVNPVLSRATALIGYVSVTRTATNLSDPTQAVFTKASRFDTP